MWIIWDSPFVECSFISQSKNQSKENGRPKADLVLNSGQRKIRMHPLGGGGGGIPGWNEQGCLLEIFKMIPKRYLS